MKNSLKFIKLPSLKFKKSLLLLILASILAPITTKITLSQGDPPPSPNGVCHIGNIWGNLVENCFRGVQWQRLQGVQDAENDIYSDVYVGTNTISRTGDAISFDYSSYTYIRFTGNCRTKIVSVIKASDINFDSNRYISVNDDSSWNPWREGLDFACSISNNRSNNNSAPTPLTSQTRLTLRGFGSVQIGMTIAQAQQATGQRFNQITSGGEPVCLYYQTNGVSNVSFMVIDGRISRIDVDNPNITTPSGGRIGLTERQIYELYPGYIRSEPHAYISAGHYLYFVPRDAEDQNYRLIFETNGNQVMRMRSGKLPDVTRIEGCV